VLENVHSTSPINSNVALPSFIKIKRIATNQTAHRRTKEKYSTQQIYFCNF
jgi:hypothetical protein